MRVPLRRSLTANARVVRAEDRPPAPDDPAWVDRIRAGEAQAFEAAFRALDIPLTAFARRTVGSREVAQDIVQEVFVRLWTDRESLVVRDNLRGYLYAVVHRRALNALRHDRVEARSRDAFLLVGRSPATGALPADAGQEAERRETVQAVEHALAVVPPRAREVALLRWADGLARGEIATALGISIKTVDAHLQLATRLVRARLRTVWP